MGDIDADNLRKQISTLTQLIEIDEKIDNLDDIVFELVCRCIESKIETDNATIIAACIYRAGRTGREQLISLDEIAKLSKINRKQIGKTYRLIIRELNLVALPRDLLAEVRRNQFIHNYLDRDMYDETLNQIGTFINKFREDIKEIEISIPECNIIIPLIVLGSGDKYTVEEVLIAGWFPHRGSKAREYLRNTSTWEFNGKGYQGSAVEPQEVFSVEKYNQLLHQDEIFQEVLQRNKIAYDLLKLKTLN